MVTALLIGTLDTKGREYAFVRDRLIDLGVDVSLMDVGVLGTSGVAADIGPAEVSAAAGVDLRALRFEREGTDTRARALEVMRTGASVLTRRLVEEGRCDGVMGLGGSGGSALIGGVLQELPFGLPKVLMSTMASGDISAYVGMSDICVMPSVTDIAGLNKISRPLLVNATAALAGMMRAAGIRSDQEDAGRPAVGVTMLGVTTQGALRVVARLESAGYDVIVFHAVGSGGRALESLIAHGAVAGVIDYTIKEITDDVLGGVFNAGPERLRTAGRLGVPQVVVPGAIEVINFREFATVPPSMRDGSRPLVKHNEQVTAVRATREELRAVAEEVAARLRDACGPTAVVLPAQGFDSYSTRGGPFADPVADADFADHLLAALGNDIEVETVATHINDPAFADRVVDIFEELMKRQGVAT